MKSLAPGKFGMALLIVMGGLIANAATVPAQAPAATTKAATKSAAIQSPTGGTKTAAPGPGTTHPLAKPAAKGASGAAGRHEKWTWMDGASVPGQRGIYGTLSKAAPGNVPGARGWAVSWTDAAGNFWLFGGHGYDSTGKMGYLNDLWKYSKGEWTWMGGSKVNGQGGTYGTQGTAAAGNAPGARDAPVGWTDAAGNFWLFGGEGFGNDAINAGYLNDLWKYSGGEWTWESGPNVIDDFGTYGTQGTAAAANVPRGRTEAASSTDAAGNLWMFGGDSLYWGGDSGDLWKYGAGEWTWMGADSVTGTYGGEGSAAAGNIPGARDSAASWTDAEGDFWMFGGFGFDSTGTNGDLNDLWKYSAGEWTWMGGSNVIGAKGTYGAKGAAAAGNIPGARTDSVRWTDAAGNVWLFGGYAYDSAGKEDNLNDLWKYSAGEWTSIGGPKLIGAKGVFGTKGTAAAGNIPGPRWDAAGWIDANGNMWLFGGFVQNAAGVREYLNDLWKYEP
jgi:hypothetical protein